MKYKIEQEKCRKCKMCLRSRCQAIISGDKMYIDTNKCNGCGICSNICPMGAIVKIEK